MPKSLPSGSTDVTTYFVLRDATTHAPKADVTVTDIDLYYQEQGAAQAAKADVTALDAADSAHADNKGYHCGNGVYRIDWPDAAFDAGVGKTVILIVVCSGVDTCYREIILSPQVDVVSIEGSDATNQIRDALVDDATRIDASALNTLSGHDPGETIMGATDLGTGSGLTALASAADLADIPTNSELATALSGLNDLDAAGVQTAAAAALTAYDPPTKAELDSAVSPLATAASISGLNDFDPASDVVAHVTLVDTTTTNTDMVAAAPSAASVADAVWDEAATGHTDAGKAGQQLWTDVDAILADTGELQTNQGDWATATGFSTHSAADVWGVATRTITALDEDTTTIDIDSAVAAGVPAASAVADAVWDEALSGHAAGGTAGAALSAASAPSAADVADAVWDETLSGHAGVGSAGAALSAAGGSGDPWATALPGAYEAGTAGAIIGTTIPAAIDAVDNYVDSEVTALTNELAKVPKSDGTASWNSTALAAIQGECTDALEAYDPPTKAELDAADDAVLAAVAALPTDADVQTAAAAALTAYDPPTKAELDSAVLPLATAAGVTALGTPLQAANYTAPDNAGIAAAEAAAGAAQTAAEAIVTDYAKATDVAALNDVSTAEVQTAATAALTAYDPPTRTEATSDKAEVIAALGDITVDVGDITASVDLTPVTDALAPIEATLSALGAGPVTVVSPVTETGEVVLYAGDDYSAAHGRALQFNVADAGHALVLDTGTVLLKVAEATFEATTVTETTAGYTVAFEPTRSETAALATIAQDYEIEAELADGDVVTLATGRLTTKRDIPEVE